MPEPTAERSAGPIRPGRGSDKIAVVTGAARGIGRAIAVEMAANGADVVVIDIAGEVSPASNAVPATPEELDETVRMIKSFGRHGEAVKANIGTSARCARSPTRSSGTTGRSISWWRTPRSNAGCLSWEMEDSERREVIDNNLTAPPTPCEPSRRVCRWNDLEDVQVVVGNGEDTR